MPPQVMKDAIIVYLHIDMRNTDDLAYGGSGVTNLGHVEAEELPWNGRPASVSLRPPPLGAVFLRPSRD